MSRLFILSGPSGCGKTTLMNNALKENSSLIAVQKYGTRQERASIDGIEDDVCQVFRIPIPCEIYSNSIPKDKLNLLTPYYIENNETLELKKGIIKEDLKHLSKILEYLKIRNPSISLGESNYWNNCGDQVKMNGCIDIAYALNKGQYGISTQNVKHALKRKKNVITILSDFLTIRRLKNIFKDKIVVIYIASAVDTAKLEKIQIGRLGINKSLEEALYKKVKRLNSSVRIKKWENVARWIHDLNEDWKNTKPDAESTAVRSERIKMFHTRYIDNIILFDHVILNYNEGHPEDMTIQFNNILKRKSKKSIIKKSPLFVVSAASNAGKGTMMEMLNLIGTDRIQILSKIAKRKKKANDKKDGMLAIGTVNTPPEEWPQWPKWWTQKMIDTAKLNEFPSEYDFSWTFHGKSVHYAVSDKEIRYNFKKNKPQIVISNTHQIKEFIKRYGERVIFILLFRLSSIEDTKKYYEIDQGLTLKEASIRANEVDNVLKEYVNKINFFNHVILNTTRPEDLYDQIFQLVEYYYQNIKQ